MRNPAQRKHLTTVKLLRRWPNHNDEAGLTAELVRLWGPLDGAPEEVWAAISNQEEAREDKNSALELAIVSTAKRFLSQPIIQHLVEAIYKGDLVYAPVVNRSLIPDSYVEPRKGRAKNAADVYEYNPYVAGWLDVSRLRVPKWRHWIEFGTFAMLIALFAATLLSELPLGPFKLTTSTRLETPDWNRDLVQSLHDRLHPERVGCGE